MTAQPAGEPPVIANDESRLALAFQRGEDGAYDVIYRRYADMVRHHCERILCDPEDAQDAVQETFLRVYNRLDSFNGRWLLEAWIKRIATNICFDKLRQRNRRSGEQGTEALHGSAFVRAAEDPEHVVIRRAEIGGVLKKIGALPELQRDAVVLRDVHDLAHRDIAAVLQISEARARVLIHRAHKTLRGSGPVGLVISFGPRLWRKILRSRVDSPEPVTAYVYQASAHISEVADTAGMFFKHGGSVAQGIATVAAAAVVGAGAGLPITNAALGENFRTFAIERTDDRSEATFTATSSDPADSSNDGRQMLAQVTAATTAELESEPIGQEKATSEETGGEKGDEPVVGEVAAVQAEPVQNPPEDSPTPLPPAENGAQGTDEGPAGDEAPVEVPLGPAPAEDVPAEEVPVGEAPAEEAPAEETPAEEAPAEETPVEQPSAESPAAEPGEAPSDGTTSPTTDPGTSPTSPTTEPSTSPSSSPAETPSAPTGPPP